MSLWIDKYRPNSFEDFFVRKDMVNDYLGLGDSDEIPHLILNGPSGSGRTTLIRGLVGRIFMEKHSESKLKYDERIFVTPSGKKISLTVFSGVNHLEFTPSDAGIYDRVVISEIVKDVAQTHQVSKTAKGFKGNLI